MKTETPRNLRVFNHLPQQNAFGDEPDFGFGRRDVFKPDLVADFIAEPDAEFLRHARGEQSRSEPARLQDDDLAARRKPCRRSICGTCVDLPEPVGADRISRRSDFRRAIISPSIS